MPSSDPNQNPFQSMPQPPKPAVKGPPPVYGRPQPHTARLGFFDCFFEAKTFFGTEYWLFWGLIFVAGLLSGIIPLILVGPLYCGIGLCFLAQERGQRPSFDLMFKGFDSFMESLIPVLLYGLLLLVIIPCYLVGWIGGLVLISSGDEVAIISGICLMIAGISIMLLGSVFMSYGFMFSSFLVAEYKLQGMEAFKVSLSGIQKNFFGLFAVSIATAIIATAGLMLCYIPFFLMLPLFMGSGFICYRKIFRPRTTSPKQRVKIDLPK